jgi:hypothetical protein
MTKRLAQGQIGRRYFADGYLPKTNLMRQTFQQAFLSLTLRMNLFSCPSLCAGCVPKFRLPKPRTDVFGNSGGGRQ